MVVDLVQAACSTLAAFERGWLEGTRLNAGLFLLRGHRHIGFADLTVSFHRRMLHQVGDMGVNVQRGCRGNVTDDGGQGLHIHAVFQRHRGEGMTEVMEPHGPKSHVLPSPKYYCFVMGQPSLYLPYCSDNSNDTIPILLILFRRG